MSDIRAQQAREHHRSASQAEALASGYRQLRNHQIRVLRAEDPARWSYPALAKLIGCSEALIAAIVKERTGTVAEPGTCDDLTHVYLSTGCLHGEHTYCQSMTGLAGAKRAGRCKFCDAHCVCACHAEAFTCPRCLRTSWNPNDREHGYCGACHDFTGVS